MKVLSIILLGFLCIAVVSAETWAEARVRHSKGNFVVSENEFEYVVVGAGPGGCATAATLSGQGKKTLLLERGLPRSKNWQTQTILGWPDVVNSEAGEEIRTESGVWTITAKSMGGATALNGGAFLFEKKSFWEKYSNRFDIDEMYHAYDWVKDRLPHPLPYGDYAKARLEACDQAGFAQWGFHNYSLDNPLGTQTLWATFYNKDGVLTRNAADVLLDTKNPLLTIRTEAKVTNIEFVDGSTPDKPRASCVQYNWNNKVHVVCPKKEIVMSAGAIWTPFLLQKSGVGPAEHLKQYGVRVIKDIPAIGKNLHDKPVVNLVTFYHWNMSTVPFTAIETGCTDPTPFLVEQTSGGNITSSFGIATLALVPPEYRFEALRPIMKLIMGTPGPVKKILNHSSQFLSPLTHPYSRGTLGLKRSTPFSDLSPAIDFNYWSDPRDLTAAIYTLRKLEEIVNTPAMRPWLYRKEKNTFTELTDAIATLVDKTPFKNVFNWAACEVLPEGQVVTLPCTPDLTSDEAIKTWLMTYHASSYHIAGTMEMGVVLDRDFRVIGIENLRVADASVLPQITEVNPQGTIEMIGRYAGLRILGLKAKDLAAAHAHDEL